MTINLDIPAQHETDEIDFYNRKGGEQQLEDVKEFSSGGDELQNDFSKTPKALFEKLLSKIIKQSSD